MIAAHRDAFQVSLASRALLVTQAGTVTAVTVTSHRRAVPPSADWRITVPYACPRGAPACAKRLSDVNFKLVRLGVRSCRHSEPARLSHGRLPPAPGRSEAQPGRLRAACPRPHCGSAVSGTTGPLAAVPCPRHGVVPDQACAAMIQVGGLGHAGITESRRPGGRIMMIR
jgi:hypothetical protein